MKDKITIKRKVKQDLSKKEKFMINFELWVAYWRANPHRFITDYLQLKLYDFQKVLIYLMFHHSNFIFIASRGLAKSTLSLIFAVAYCIVYPNTTIVVVAPTKSQSARFVKKIYELMKSSPNLRNEINVGDIKNNVNESKIPFFNGSEIITVPYSENALGQRCQILIIDEFVRTEKEIISRVFVPFLTSPRQPPYTELSFDELEALPIEQNKQLYLSSIRGADEWSYEYFLYYLEEMKNSNPAYITVALPYNFGVKHRYITKAIVEQSFKENQESTEMLLAEYVCKPEKSSNDSFFKFYDLNKTRNVEKCLIAMTDEEYVEYRNNKKDWDYYVEKLPNEIRIMSVDIALLESKKNDDTAIWIMRLIPDGGKYKKIVSYLETMHGINSVIQTKRIKQLFYEMDCDYCVMDVQGNGIGIYDVATSETFDEVRNEVYPAWIVDTYEDIGMIKRSISDKAVPIVRGVKTSTKDKSFMLGKLKDIFKTNDINIPVDVEDAIDFLNSKYKYFKLDESIKVRMLTPYVQTTIFINEATQLKKSIKQGFLTAEERSGKRKDRVMSLTYGIAFALELEANLQKPKEDNWFLSYIQNC